MKENSRILVGLALLLIIGLIYGTYNYYSDKKEENNKPVDLVEEEIVEVITDEFNLPYVSVYLTNEGNSYIVPIEQDKIDELDIGNNLKERLKTLYNRAVDLEIMKEDKKLKGFEVKLDDIIKKLYVVSIKDKDYILFHKENNKLGFFDYDSYYNLMYTEVLDNYNNIENVLKIDNNELYFIDGSSVKLDTVIK